jgi:hypothetical protein
MAKHVTKKRVILIAVAALAIGLGTSAFAYFTSSGNGSGSAAVGSAATVELSGSPVGTLYPGGPDLPVTVTIHNAGSGSQRVGTVSGAVANANSGTCLGSWFVVDSVDYNQVLAPGASDTVSTTVSMPDSGTNQDACQGQALTINWSSN